MAALFRGRDKAMTTMNNLAEALNRHGNCKEVED